MTKLVEGNDCAMRVAADNDVGLGRPVNAKLRFRHRQLTARCATANFIADCRTTFYMLQMSTI